MNRMQRIVPRLGILLLAIFRTLYCWVFFLWTCFAIQRVYLNIRSLARTQLVDRGDIISNMTIAIYSIVLGIAWWMILRSKPASKRWAVAANLTLIFTYFPALLVGNWQGFLEGERDWWPVILIGIFGIIIFSIPYHGWQPKSQMPVK